MPNQYTGPVDRDALFRAKVDYTDDCWLWAAALFGPDGYGAFRGHNGRQVGAHQYAWVMASSEPIPPKHGVYHTCDVRRCVRNDDSGVYVVRGVEYPRFGHLWLGTQAANIADMIDKRRGLVGDLNPNRINIERAPRGESHGCAKLTADAVLEIRTDLAAGVLKTVLARKHGVTRQLIRRIELRQVWAHI